LCVIQILAFARTGATQELAALRGSRSCAALPTTDFSTIQDAATQVTATRWLENTAGGAHVCDVTGYVAPQVGFQLLLPTDSWNGKFLEVGCGGWCGKSATAACEGPLHRGFACIATDMGHFGTSSDVLWAHDNIAAMLDFGYRATHVVAIAGK